LPLDLREYGISTKYFIIDEQGLNTTRVKCLPHRHSSTLLLRLLPQGFRRCGMCLWVELDREKREERRDKEGAEEGREQDDNDAMDNGLERN
jgi:hypothetical protein